MMVNPCLPYWGGGGGNASRAQDAAHPFSAPVPDNNFVRAEIILIMFLIMCIQILKFYWWRFSRWNSPGVMCQGSGGGGGSRSESGKFWKTSGLGGGGGGGGGSHNQDLEVTVDQELLLLDIH